MTAEPDQLELEQRLEGLLGQESFEPPAAFAQAASLNDPAIYAEAAPDSPAWWGERARELDWFEPFTTTLDDSAAPFYKWFEDGKLNASHNCLDRHVEAGLGDRVAFHWFGEEGEQRDITYA